MTLPWRTMHAFLPNQPDSPCKSGVLLIILVALVALAVLIALVALVWAVVPKGEVFEHCSSFRGLRPKRGSKSISSSLKGRSTKPSVLEHFELVRGSFDQVGSLRAFRARSGVIRPSQGKGSASSIKLIGGTSPLQLVVSTI